MKSENFKKGLLHGIPIALGYLAVSFSFGIFAVNLGLSVLEAVLISMANLTSAGQLAGAPIIASGGSLFSLGLGQVFVNLRYALMSISLSQKLDRKVTLADRFLISFGNTDEIFAVACGKDSMLGRRYLLAIAIFPYLGWSLGTLFGALLGGVLPSLLIASMSVAIYAMFIAIITPAAKAHRATAICVFLAIAASFAFEYLPYLSRVHNGIVIVVITVVLSALFALIAPISEVDPWEEEERV